MITFLTSAAVTIKDLITELHDVISWFQLGIYLDISPSELMKIRTDHREKTDVCKTEMLMTWLRQTTDASWSAVVRALVGIRMGALAQKIAVKYGESVPHKLKLIQSKMCCLCCILALAMGVEIHGARGAIAPPFTTSGDPTPSLYLYRDLGKS